MELGLEKKPTSKGSMGKRHTTAQHSTNKKPQNQDTRGEAKHG